jgi:PadR family transcriptional regulator
MSNEKKDSRTQFVRGTLDLMILRSLESLGPLHGYAIAARLEQISRGALVPNMGTLYPGLMRLEQRGLIRASWGTTENNRKARYYRITAAGRRELAAEKKEWDRMVSIMHALFGDA